jgi:hypothetical protein
MFAVSSHDDDGAIGMGLQGQVEYDFRNGFRGYMMFMLDEAESLFVAAVAPTGIVNPRASTKERAGELEVLAARYRQTLEKNSL